MRRARVAPDYERHLNGEEGASTKAASQFAFEKTTNAVAREKELLEEFKKANNGQMPRCNEVTS